MSETGSQMSLAVLPLDAAVMLPRESRVVERSEGEVSEAVRTASALEEEWLAALPLTGWSPQAFGPSPRIVLAVPRLDGEYLNVGVIAWLGASGYPTDPPIRSENLRVAETGDALQLGEPLPGELTLPDGSPGLRLTGLARAQLVSPIANGRCALQVVDESDSPPAEELVAQCREVFAGIAAERLDYPSERRAGQLEQYLSAPIEQRIGDSWEPLRPTASLLADFCAFEHELPPVERAVMLMTLDGTARLEQAVRAQRARLGVAARRRRLVEQRGGCIAQAIERARRGTKWGSGDTPFCTLGEGDEAIPHGDGVCAVHRRGDAAYVRGVTVDLGDLDVVADSDSRADLYVVADVVRLPERMSLGDRSELSSLTVVARRVEGGSVGGRQTDSRIDIFRGSDGSASADADRFFDLWCTEVGGNISVRCGRRTILDAGPAQVWSSSFSVGSDWWHGRAAQVWVTEHHGEFGTATRHYRMPSGWVGLRFRNEASGARLVLDRVLPERLLEVPWHLRAAFVDLTQLALAQGVYRSLPSTTIPGGDGDRSECGSLAQALLPFVAEAASHADERGEDEWIRLAQRCSALATLLTDPGQGVLVVPERASEKYEEDAERFLQAARDLSGRWTHSRMDAADAQRLGELHRKGLELLIGFEEDARAWRETRQALANANRDHARVALVDAQARTRTIIDVDLAREIDLLERELRAREADEARKEVWGIVGGVFKIVGRIVAAVVKESPEPLIPIVSDITDLANGITSHEAAIHDARSARDAVGSIGYAAEQILTTSAKVRRAIEEADAIIERGDAGPERAAAVEATREIASRLVGVTDLTASTAWRNFLNAQMELLEWALGQGFPAARKLRASLQEASEWGQQAAAAEAAFFKATQELWDAQVQREVSAAKAERCRGAFEAGDFATLADLDTRLYFFQQVLDAKLAIITALVQYSRASFYANLRIPASVEFCMVDSTEDLSRAFAELVSEIREEEVGLQDVERTFRLDDQLVDRFRREREVEVTVPLAHEDLAGFDRVRVRRVRAWLGGLDLGEERVELRISTSGWYEDRRGSQTFRFLGPPVSRAFEYRQAEGRRRPKIETDGELDPRRDATLFSPTVFTNWTIQLRNACDLTNLARIDLEFKLEAELRDD